MYLSLLIIVSHVLMYLSIDALPVAAGLVPPGHTISFFSFFSLLPPFFFWAIAGMATASARTHTQILIKFFILIIIYRYKDIIYQFVH